MLNFSNTNVLLCVTGGIAAYKSAEIIRLFKKDGADVRVVMTESAKEFITPLTLQAVSGNEIHDSLLDVKAESAMGHIELAKWADIILIAPCTAESLAKITHGRADDLMGSLILASNAISYIAPAMNTTMWLDKSTQENFQTLVRCVFIVSKPQHYGDLLDWLKVTKINLNNYTEEDREKFFNELSINDQELPKELLAAAAKKQPL